MPKTKTIILSGRGQSGKSTSVDFLKTFFSQSLLLEVAFAEPLKIFAIDVMGLTHDQCYGSNEQKNTLTHIKWENLPLDKSEIAQITKKNETFLTGREFMEVFGTRICRRMYPDCWVNGANNYMKDRPGDLFGRDIIHVISDARFPNEIDFFYNNVPDCIIIRLLRNPLNRDVETDLDNYDFSRDRMYVIDNREMTIEQKNDAIASILKNIL